MAIPRETIELVRTRARIEEIIARYVPSLKKRGMNFVGLCPFHKEKTPSFIVSPDKQIYHCFGCHSGGNVFSFVEKTENLNFPQSVKFIGKIVGVDVSDEDSPRDSIAEDILRINQYAAKLYSAFLTSPDGTPGINYLQKRGVAEESIGDFKLGYAPESWDFLVSRLKNQNADLSKAALSGLLGSKQDTPGRYYDKYRGRVIFPIIDQYGNIAGFGGRIIGDGEPKYLNSAESPVYKKRQMLYGYFQGKSEISSLQRVIIVEGYLDVIGCHQAGIRNVVAPLGTALTEEQVKLLSRSCTEIILLFDADSAGIKASIRSLDVIKDLNIAVKVASLPEDDPFEYIQKRGIREFMSVVDSALPPADYKIKRVLSIKKEPMQTLIALFEVVKELNFDAERNEYLKKIAKLTGYDQKTVISDFQRYLQRGERPVQIIKNEQKNNSKQSYLSKCCKDLLVLLINQPSLLNKAVLDFSPDDFEEPLHKMLFSRLSELYNSEEVPEVDKLFDIFRADDEKRFLEENVSLSFSPEKADDAYTEIYLNIRQYNYEQKITYYDELIRSNPSDPMNQEYLTEIHLLTLKMKELSAYVYNMKDAVKR
jgi:DNA primase